jgi:lipopolysaccharide biosynthesis protein
VTAPRLWSQTRELLRPRTRWRAFRARKPLRLAPARPGWPADFSTWAARSEGRRSDSYPATWRGRVDLPIPAPSRVGVIVHAFYPELVAELIDRLKVIPVDFDLLVTNATGRDLDLPTDVGRAVNVRVLEVPNRGRDILPLVSLVNAGYLDPYHLILKVHTKRSEWRETHELEGDGATWRNMLLDSLLGSEAEVSDILAVFAERSDVGLVTADGSVLGPEAWGDNEDNTANLLRRIELILDPTTLQFAAGSMYWIRGFALQGLRSLDLSAVDFEDEEGQVNQTTAHAVERLIGVVLREAGYALHERSTLPEPTMADTWHRFETGRALLPRARVIPFYLPQFHPIPENDRWWGAGFTEWTNVTAAQPVYEGQYQPRLPTDLGFYDLRLDETRAEQLQMSAGAGVAGFMYYHYWFAGSRLLETPIWKLHQSGIQQPFCVMWANENWTRRWDGRHDDVLVAQDYDRAPASEFIVDVLSLLADDRYLTIGGRKVIAVYRAGQVPDLAHAVRAWRDRARQAGVGDLCILSVDVALEFDGVADVAELGLDGSLGFPPHNHHWQWLPHSGLGVDERFTGNLLSYGALVESAERRLRAGVDPGHYPGVMVAFDNTPRRQWESDVWYGSNPYTFRRWMGTAITALVDREPDDRVVFVNAWNEWAEGAILEPTTRFGRSFLLAVRDAVLG